MKGGGGGDGGGGGGVGCWCRRWYCCCYWWWWWCLCIVKSIPNMCPKVAVLWTGGVQRRSRGHNHNGMVRACSTVLRGVTHEMLSSVTCPVSFQISVVSTFRTICTVVGRGWGGTRRCMCARARACMCVCVRVRVCVCVCVKGRSERQSFAILTQTQQHKRKRRIGTWACARDRRTGGQAGRQAGRQADREKNSERGCQPKEHQRKTGRG